MGITITTLAFGKTNAGEDITLYKLTNSSGNVLTLTDMGACWVSTVIKDKNGADKDVVLGFDDGNDYENCNNDSFGAVIGRHANRIQGHSFVLNGVKYDLADNDMGNNLHSGPDLYFTRMWKGEIVDGGVKFTLHSPDMDQGYPGNMDISVTYTFDDDNTVSLTYEGVSDKDTIFNMTNHCYFNMNGQDDGSILDNILCLKADKFMFGEGNTVITGEKRSVKGTPLDFTVPTPIGKHIEDDYEPMTRVKGIDHNFVLDMTKRGVLTNVGYCYSEKTGIKMEILTDLPGMQIYSANFFSGRIVGKSGIKYLRRSGIAFETQFYPDSPNHPDFPSVVLKAGEHFKSMTAYHFTVE